MSRRTSRRSLNERPRRGRTLGPDASRLATPPRGRRGSRGGWVGSTPTVRRARAGSRPSRESGGRSWRRRKAGDRADGSSPMPRPAQGRCLRSIKILIRDIVGHSGDLSHFRLLFSQRLPGIGRQNYGSRLLIHEMPFKPDFPGVLRRSKGVDLAGVSTRGDRSTGGAPRTVGAPAPLTFYYRRGTFSLSPDPRQSLGRERRASRVFRIVSHCFGSTQKRQRSA